jgi:hypothetical protein
VQAAGEGIQIARTHSIATPDASVKLEAAEITTMDLTADASVSGSIELPEDVRYALEVNCEVTSRAIKAAALTGRRSDAEPQARNHSGPPQPSKEELQAVKLPIKGYSVVAKLGQGGMSSVYLVERNADGLQLALKLLDTRGADSAGLLERFIQEFEVISAICHPNVAAI